MGNSQQRAEQILDGSIKNADIAADAAVSVSKLESVASRIVGNKSTGGMVMLTAAEVKAILGITSFKYYENWTWLVSGEIKVPSGASDQIGSKTLKLVSGQTAKIISCIHSIYDGTSVTVKLQKSGVDITGFTSMSVTTTESATTPTAVSLSDGDKLAPVVTNVSGTPHLLKVQMVIEFTISL